ncbi:MAG: DNA repair protein RadC [Selenomonadaceae bacterium]|nr:DNA repair protein RadC [Selenomonadaceae bacterium]
MGIKISDMPLQDMPREKLIRRGPEALTDAELLAILLGSGTSSHSVPELAQMIINEQGSDGLTGLARLGYWELKKLHGLGEAKATKLLAALELGKRSTRPTNLPVKIQSSADAVGYFRQRFAELDLTVENFLVLSLDSQLHPLSCRRISSGTVNMTVAHPREVMREVVRAAATSFLVAHNHPSGDMRPSGEDLTLTKRLVKAGETLMIPLVDHIIVSGEEYVSLRDEGIIEN